MMHLLLAALSLVGGFMNVPEALFGSERLSEFLSPVFTNSATILEEHPSTHSIEYMLMGTVIALTAVMIGLAYSMYIRKNEVPVADGVNTNMLQNASYNKYYIDEVYDKLIVKPLYWISATFDKVVERLAIDGLVNASGSSIIEWSKVFRLLQNGSIGFYINR